MKMTKKVLSSALMISASLSALASCTNAPGNVTPPQPSASATQPSANPSQNPSPNPSTSPSINPSSDPSTQPSGSPSADPSTQPSTNPSASATFDPDNAVELNTTFNGKVFDDSQAPLDNVIVSVKSLNASVPYEMTSNTVGGTYAFNNAPAGIQLEITASRPGFTTRRRIEVLKSNKQGDPNANKYDFGVDPAGGGSGSAASALSDKPEVISVTPGRNASGIDPASSLVLKFSEPMDRNTVSDSFLIRAFTTEQLSVDNDATYMGATSGLIANTDGTQVWDKAAFNISWNSDDTEATFAFKEERKLPTDKDSDKVPDYQVSFSNLLSNNLKDKSGISRSSDYFKLNDGNFEQSYKFAIKTDQIKPGVSSLVAQTAENSGVSSDGDAMRVRFSERMIHYTLGATIAGGINNVASQAAGAVTEESTVISGEQAAANYKLSVIRGSGVSTSTLINKAAWASLGGRAIFDTNDPTHKTVLLLPRSDSYSQIVGATANGIGAINGTIYYTDGSTSALSEISAADTYASVASALNNAVSGTPFAVSEVFNAAGAGTVDPNDTYRITLAMGAQGTGANAGKSVHHVTLNQSTVFDSANLNAPANGLIIFAQDGSGRSNIYQPGDNVIIEVDTTVVDPAGNSVDSSNDDVSANAS